MPQSRGHAARLAPLQACRATSGHALLQATPTAGLGPRWCGKADRADDAPIPGPFGALLYDEANRTDVDVAFGQPQRYGAAVVLFEMATGGRPCYGPDENSNPTTADDDVTLRLDMFESTITAGMVEFFGSALSRHATARPDTAEDMLRAWRAVFTTLEETDHSDDVAAEKADTTTALAAAGLTARAVSALAAVQVTTVGELLALDSTRLNRLVAREAKDTHKEITARYRAWAKRLGKDNKRAPDDALMGLDDAVELLLSAVSGARSSTRKDAAELLLGVKPGLDAFASSTELAAALDKAAQRGPQLLKELQDDWADRQDTRELLDAISEITRQVLSDFGGVAAIDTLTAEIRARLPEAAVPSPGLYHQARADRAAGGLLRVAPERLSEHETASGTKEFVRRRHGNCLALLATDELLLAAADSAAKRADDLVTSDRNIVIPPPTAARELGSAFLAGYRAVSNDAAAQTALPSEGRLIRLAAAISKHAVVSGRGELHNRDISPAAAIQTALTGLAQSESRRRTRLALPRSSGRHTRAHSRNRSSWPMPHTPGSRMLEPARIRLSRHAAVAGACARVAGAKRVIAVPADRRRARRSARPRRFLLRAPP